LARGPGPPPCPHPPTPPHLLLLLPGGGGPDRRAALGFAALVVVALALVRAAVAKLPADFQAPIRAPIRQSFVGAGLGGQAGCAELADGTATCWGNSIYGVTGRPCNNNVCAPDEVLSLGTGRTVKQLALSGYHGCAVLDNADLKCWGSNDVFQLARDNAGLNNVTGDDVDEMGDALPVVERSGVALDVVQVATGLYHTCALLADETVSCWGENAFGQLGIGLANQPSSIMNPSAPVQLGAGFVPASIVSDDSRSTYVVSTSGGVKAWGPNDYGQLGIGDTAHRGDGDPNNPSYNDMGDNLPAIEFPAGVEAIVSVSPGRDYGERGRGWTTGPFGGLAFGLL